MTTEVGTFYCFMTALSQDSAQVRTVLRSRSCTSVQHTVAKQMKGVNTILRIGSDTMSGQAITLQ